MSNYRLLIIEDEPDIAELVSMVAASAGFESQSAYGLKAKDIYDDFQPQVIILDIKMPEMDGYQFLQFLKTRNSNAHIIILSGNSDFHRIMIETIGTGSPMIIEANIPKPFRVSELRQILEKIKISLSGEKLKKRSY